MSAFHETPRSNRLHIGIFGKTNSGKSSFINAFTNQEVSIVADVPGTTTDPVIKAMEIAPLGACVIMDTAGFDDTSQLGAMRVEKTAQIAQKSDIAVIVVSAQENDLTQEYHWNQIFLEQKTPTLFVVNKADLNYDATALAEQIKRETQRPVLVLSAKIGDGMEQVKPELVRLIPEDFGANSITGNLLSPEDLVLLVMPQDMQAPKGRLILPQVQTIRELLDKQCIVMSVTTKQFKNALSVLSIYPKLIITDSQEFGYVYKHKPKESMLTSFSVLFAAYKGDLDYYVKGAKVIDTLTESSKVLIAECCTHAPLSEDIGRIKIPRMLRKRIGENLLIDIVSGTDFPSDLSSYDLVIQCGACMFHRKYVLSRIASAKKDEVPMTNYGVAIAHLMGILDKITMV